MLVEDTLKYLSCLAPHVRERKASLLLSRLVTEIERLRAGEHTVYYACEAGVYEGKLNQVTLDGDTDWVVPLTWCHATREAADAAGGET